MSNFLIFKAAFNNSATPAIGTYTAEGATAQFNKNTSISPDYYLYNTARDSAVQWFVPTKETTDFEFVADILTRNWSNNVTYFIIADSTGATRLRMWSVYTNWYFENSDGTGTSGNPEYIGVINPTTSGGFGVFHQFRVRARKLTASSSSVEVYVDGTLKLTATAGAALITCAKIGFVGGVNSFGPGTGAGIKNAYVYDLSGGDVIDRGVLSGAFNRFISWMKSKFALKSDIPTVNDGALTIQKNGTNVATFTANASTNATANIQCVDLTNNQTVGGNKEFTGTTTAHDVIPSATDTYNFGSSSAQWNNAYIKSLTINGVACGDILTHNASEFVNLTGAQTISGAKTFSDSINNKRGQQFIFNKEYSDATDAWLSIHSYFDKNNTRIGFYSIYDFSGNRCFRWFVRGQSTNSVEADILGFGRRGNETSYMYINATLETDLIPTNNNSKSLGTPTNKWKSFNGINPGALSLPSNNRIDILSTLQSDGYTAPSNGYVIATKNVKTQSTSTFGIRNETTGIEDRRITESLFLIGVMVPAKTGEKVIISDDWNSISNVDIEYSAFFYPCQGNV